jgi:hypothetical protein
MADAKYIDNISITVDERVNERIKFLDFAFLDLFGFCHLLQRSN